MFSHIIKIWRFKNVCMIVDPWVFCNLFVCIVVYVFWIYKKHHDEHQYVIFLDTSLLTRTGITTPMRTFLRLSRHTARLHSRIRALHTQWGEHGWLSLCPNVRIRMNSRAKLFLIVLIFNYLVTTEATYSLKCFVLIDLQVYLIKTL